jgi:ethanolamine utilization cobalamin adenosyltransferase
LKIITEIDLRAQHKNKNFESFVLDKGDRLTPAASQFLSERNIKIIDGDSNKSENSSSHKGNTNKSKIDIKNLQMPKEGYVCFPSGKNVLEKPEHYTHLRGRILVSTTNPIIKFRGQLDLLEANFITCINQVNLYGFKEMADDLNEIFLYLQKIMRAEVMDEELPFIEFKGWTDSEVREYSHYPDKYFGVKHFTPNPKYGNIFGEVNKLRAMMRQFEISAVEAFYDECEDKCERLDIMMALNRLSSLIYIILCKFIGGQYKI